MGKTSRKKYTPEFKARVALEALKEQSTLAELAKKYELSPAMISRWKSDLVKNASAAFGSRGASDEDIEKKSKEQCEVLGLPRSTYYYKPQEGESERNLGIMEKIDRQYTEHPAMGSRQMTDYLKGGWIQYRMPYLLRGLEITHPNQVWSTGISYIVMKHGFMYLYAIIDVYSRCIVGWGLYNTLDASNAVEVLERAISEHGRSRPMP